MGSTGDAYDNAMAESFFATLQREVLNRRRFAIQAEAQMAIFQWLEGRCLRRSLLIGQLHPYNRGGHEESHPPVHLSHEPDRWDGVRYLRV